MYSSGAGHNSVSCLNKLLKSILIWFKKNSKQNGSNNSKTSIHFIKLLDYKCKPFTFEV